MGQKKESHDSQSRPYGLGRKGQIFNGAYLAIVPMASCPYGSYHSSTCHVVHRRSVVLQLVYVLRRADIAPAAHRGREGNSSLRACLSKRIEFALKGEIFGCTRAEIEEAVRGIATR